MNEKISMEDIFEPRSLDSFEKTINEGNMTEIVCEIIQIYIEMLQNPQKVSLLFDNWSDTLNTIEKNYINDLDEQDRKYYLSLQKRMDTALEVNKNQFINQLIVPLFKRIEKRFPFEKLFYNLLIISEKKSEFLSILTEERFNEIEEKFGALFTEIIESNRKYEFEKHFFDFTLKFGYLLEGYIKDLLLFERGLKRMELKKDVSINFTKSTTFGNLNLSPSHIPNVRELRNAINHSAFELIYDIDYVERKVIFQGGSKYEIKIVELIKYFLIAMDQFRTFKMCINFYIMKLNSNQMEGYFKEFLESIEEWPKETLQINFSGLKENIRDKLEKEL